MTQRSATATRVMIAGNRKRGLLRLALAGIIVLIAVSYISPAYNFYSRTNVISREKAVNEELRIRNEQLTQEKQQLQQDPYIEAAARQELGLVRPGEQPFIVKDVEASVPTAGEKIAPEAPVETDGGAAPSLLWPQ